MIYTKPSVVIAYISDGNKTLFYFAIIFSVPTDGVTAVEHKKFYKSKFRYQKKSNRKKVKSKA